MNHDIWLFNQAESYETSGDPDNCEGDCYNCDQYNCPEYIENLEDDKSNFDYCSMREK